MSVEAMSPEQRASNGFEFLNLIAPENWRERIDVALLDIDHGYLCVLGQIFANEADDAGYDGDGYVYALAEFEFDRFGSNEELIFYGLYSLNMDSDGPALTAAWRSLLRGETEPLKAPTVRSEDEVKEGQCGYQSSYGMPWEEYCTFPQGEDSKFCPGHERDHFEQYGRRA